jgi:hypothetical protein
MLSEDQKQAGSKVNAELYACSHASAIRKRMDAAYVDKLDGKISEEFWNARQVTRS